MQLFMLQLVFIAAAIIGSAQAAIATLPNAQEFATSTGSLLNVDSLLAFPQEAESATNRKARDLQITPCSLSDPNRNECIKDLLSEILPHLKGDLPEYGLNSIEPYLYRRGIFRFSNEGVHGGLLLKNTKIHGISDMKFKFFNGNFTDDDFIVKIGVESKKIAADGQFKADVKFGGLQLAPKGPFNVTIENLRATILTDGIFTKEDNSVRLKLKRLNANMSIGNSKIIANGIFSDHNLNAMIINLVNENLPEIIRIGVPATRDQWAPVLVEHINNIFAQVPIEKFLIP